MTKNELNKFRAILEAKKAELELFVRNRDGIAMEKMELFAVRSGTNCPGMRKPRRREASA